MAMRDMTGIAGPTLARRPVCDAHAAIEALTHIRDRIAAALPSKADPVAAYLAAPAPVEGFDPAFVSAYYPLSMVPGEDPLAFYCRNAHATWCFPNAEAAGADAADIRTSNLFDPASMQPLMAPEAALDPAVYYCTEAYRLLVAPSDRFDAAAYMIQNADVAEAGVNPLLHYERHGRGEGRPAPGRAELAAQPALFSLDGMLAIQPAPHDRRPMLVNCNQGGLMNRLIPMLSLVDQAERTGRRPAVWWTPNSHCAARFPDLFDTGGEGMGPFDTKGLTGRTHSVWTNRIEGDGTPPLDIASLAEIGLIHSVTPWATQGSEPTSYRRIADLFARFSLSLPVREKLARFDGMDFSRTIGLHIRRPYPNGAFAELEQAKFGLPLDAYVRFVEWVRQLYPDLDAVLLCTNGNEVEPYLATRLGNIFSFKKDSVDNTSDAVAVQNALVDLSLMARCHLVVSQSTTSFGFFASVIGSGRLLSIQEEFQNKTQFIISRYGERIRDVAADAEGAAAVAKAFSS